MNNDSGDAPIWLILTLSTAGLFIVLWTLLAPTLELLAVGFQRHD
jgi:hypothetical protein